MKTKKGQTNTNEPNPFSPIPATDCAGCGLRIRFRGMFTRRTQAPPSVKEMARYSGLHAAAHKGDVGQIEKLIASKADVNVRDPYGPTPLHVATFSKQRNAIRALAG